MLAPTSPNLGFHVSLLRYYFSSLVAYLFELTSLHFVCWEVRIAERLLKSGCSSCFWFRFIFLTDPLDLMEGLSASWLLSEPRDFSILHVVVYLRGRCDGMFLQY